MDLFDYVREQHKEKESPLASRMRPRTIDEVVGQGHILGEGKLLTRAILADKLQSVIFYGPPGTGKTLTATLIGKKLGMDVYRVDLSQVVSKYIGETEKNLSNIFDQAESRNWILFFDEADSLFGARTQTNNSNDRAANQEISYLLQRVEDFPGIVILASNLKSNIDEAFSRRFQSSVYFPMPEAEERLTLWKNIFEKTPVENREEIFEHFAEKYELAGGALTNVARYAAISAIMDKHEVINKLNLQQAISRELLKEGKIV